MPAFHDLRDNKSFNPSNYNKMSHNILGLGLNFIPRNPFTTDPQDIDINCFERDAHTKFIVSHDTSSPIPKLFIRSNFCPDINQINPIFISLIKRFIIATQSLFIRKKLNSN